ncbi:Ig-like domain-containing protein [Curtobacterium sp. MCPF17_002]|uniref:beta strand repeat-containing protein n=1 Tax=Curtobacterium sp. MCPF17_002 TaxID=2175645 RepID=UPI0015E8B343|nr:Ig-like domain-containing protein [Curtobacterium sp. MCPF17_002]WIB78044.1 Ig-like domain-containing protein [Curtobacterium sp. MCPF17_002]
MSSVDVSGRSAVLSGRATAGGKLLFNGGGQLTVPDSGQWTKTVTGLKLGKNDIKVEQYVDGAKKDDVTVVADLAIAPLNVEHSFSQNTNDRVKVSGTADKAANVIIRTADGKKQSVPVGSDGTWETTVPAPNKGGNTTITVAQELPKDSGGSDETTPVEHTINYGAGVSVTSPGDDAGHTGGPLEMRGRGEPDSKVLITEKGKPAQIIGETDVLVNGTWSLSTADLDSSEHTIVATQKSKGQNSTIAEITVNPGQGSEVAPLVVTTPANGSTVETKRPVFSGTGDKGATIEIAGTSRVVATTTVDSDGKWSVPAGFDLGDAVYNLTVKQAPVSGAVSAQPVTFTIKDTAGYVALTATGAFDADVSKPATISGKATAGAVVIVRDAVGNEIARTIATSNNAYTIAIPANKAQFGVNDFTVTQTVKGETSAPVNVSLDYGTPTPVNITSPENGATVDKNDLTFTGTGQTGAKIDIRGSVNAIATGSVVNGQWSAKVNYPLTNNVYNLSAVQTTKGGLTTKQAITVTVTDQSVAPLTATAAFNASNANLPAAITGTGQDGATVTVKNKGVTVGTATVAGGKYTVSIDPKHATFGINTFTITQTVNGKESAPLNRTLDYGNPTAPVITTPANGATVAAGKVTFTGTGDSGSKIDIRGTSSTVGTSTIANGAWSVETRELTANVYKLFAVQTSKGGLTKQVETTITLENKKVTELTATGTFGAVDADATISGNAETGAPVVIKEGSTVITTVTAVNGKYSATIPATTSGIRTFTVTQTVDGVVSPAKTATLDYGTVTDVQVTSPTNGAYIKAGTVTFTGTGTPGAIVKVSGTSNQLGAATVNAQGDWSLTLTRELTAQQYTLFTKQTTKGNLVGDAVERSFTVIN